MPTKLVAPDPLRLLVDRVGIEGDAASMAGTLHAKMEELAARAGVEGDAASMAGSLHAKAESIYAKAAGVPAGSAGYVYPDCSGMTAATADGLGLTSFGAWSQVTASVGGSPVLLTHLHLMDIGSWSGSSWLARFQLGVGGSGSEVAIVDITGYTLYFQDVHFGRLGGGIRLPASSRLALRIASTGGSSCSAKVSRYAGVPL